MLAMTVEQVDSEKEHHELTASDGTKRGVEKLFQSVNRFVKELPDEARYDVHIEIEEVEDG